MGFLLKFLINNDKIKIIKKYDKGYTSLPICPNTYAVGHIWIFKVM